MRKLLITLILILAVMNKSSIIIKNEDNPPARPISLSSKELVPKNSTSNITNKGLAIEDEDEIYFSDGTSLYSMNKDGTEVNIIAKESYPSSIQVIGDEIYYINEDTEYIYKVKKNGLENRQISKDKAYCLNIYNDKIYFMDRYNKLYITTMTLDAKNKEVIEEVVANDMVVYKDYIYYISKDGDIGRVKVDGEESKIIESDVLRFDIYEDGIYYIYDPAKDNKPEGLFFLDLDKNESVQLLTETPYSFNVHDGYIYYNHPISYNLYSMLVDGTSKKNIVGTNTMHINVAGDYIFYRNIDDNKKLYRVNKDGSNRKSLEGKTLVSNVTDLSKEISSLDNKELNPKLRRSYDYAKEIIDEIISPHMDEYERTKAVHDYIVANTRYDIQAADNFLDGQDADSNSFTAYGVLINNKGVCQGYAEATQILLSLAGIESELVIGSAMDENGQDVPHMWNVVQVDGKYYMLDTTWDDPVGMEDLILYNYFLVDSKTLSQTHTWAYDEYPECNHNLRYAP